MKDKTKEMIERVRRLLLDKDGISYSDDTIIQVALKKEIEDIEKE